MEEYVVDDAVEVIVLTKRGKQPEWVPGTVTAIAPFSVEVTFDNDGTKQRFPLPSGNRVRLAGQTRAKEGDTWVFSI